MLALLPLALGTTRCRLSIPHGLVVDPDHQPADVGLACTSIHASQTTGNIVIGMIQEHKETKKGHYQLDVARYLEGGKAQHGTDNSDFLHSTYDAISAVPGLGRDDGAQAGEWSLACDEKAKWCQVNGKDANGKNNTYGMLNLTAHGARHYWNTEVVAPPPTVWHSKSLKLLFALIPVGKPVNLRKEPKDVSEAEAVKFTGYNSMAVVAVSTAKGPIPGWKKGDFLPELPSTRTYETAVESPLGVDLQAKSPKLLLWDNKQVVGLPALAPWVTAKKQDGPADRVDECCGTDGNADDRCTDMVYFHYAAPCVPGDDNLPGYEKNSPGCFKHGERSTPLHPLPDLFSPVALLDNRYSPAMIFSCSQSEGNNETGPTVKLTWANLEGKGMCKPFNKPDDCLVQPSNAVSRASRLASSPRPLRAAPVAPSHHAAPPTRTEYDVQGEGFRWLVHGAEGGGSSWLKAPSEDSAPSASLEHSKARPLRRTPERRLGSSEACPELSHEAHLRSLQG